MNSWLALPLTLLLGQAPVTPPNEDTFPLVEPGPGPTGLEDPNAEQAPGVRLGAEPGREEGQPDALTEAEQRKRTLEEMERIRARLEALQADVELQRQQDEARLQALQQQQTLQQERAQELERLRQLRLASLQRAYDWLLTAEQLLAEGERDIGPALASAQRELATALASSAEAGRGETTLLIERARDRLSTVDNAVSQRDLYPARLALQNVGFDVRQAWLLTLNRQGTTLVNQDAPDVTP